MSPEARVRHEFEKGNLCFVLDFDGTIVPKGQPEPSDYTRRVIEAIKPHLLIVTARWGPTCVRHHLGQDVRVIGAQGLELNLSPGEPSEVLSENIRSLHPDLIKTLKQIKHDYPIVNINELISNDGTLALFVQWNKNNAARDRILAVLNWYMLHSNCDYRHIINHDCSDVEVVPKAATKQDTLSQVLGERGLFSNKVPFVAGDTPATDGPMLEVKEVRQRNGVTAFVGSKPYKTDLRYETPYHFMRFIGDMAGVRPNPAALAGLYDMQKPLRTGQRIPAY